MHIQVTTGEDATGDAALFARIEERVREILGHHAEEITGVVLHLNDENAGREGGDDKHCSLEVRAKGHRAIAVSHNAATVEDAALGAARTMRGRLDHVLGRRSDVRGRDTIRKPGAP